MTSVISLLLFLGQTFSFSNHLFDQIPAKLKTYPSATALLCVKWTLSLSFFIHILIHKFLSLDEVSPQNATVSTDLYL